ncbi:MAG: hypothetical protein V4490_00635 [Pseudomonadota bacterium]
MGKIGQQRGFILVAVLLAALALAYPLTQTAEQLRFQTNEFIVMQQYIEDERVLKEALKGAAESVRRFGCSGQHAPVTCQALGWLPDVKYVNETITPHQAGGYIIYNIAITGIYQRIQARVWWRADRPSSSSMPTLYLYEDGYPSMDAVGAANMKGVVGQHLISGTRLRHTWALFLAGDQLELWRFNRATGTVVEAHVIGTCLAPAVWLGERHDEASGVEYFDMRCHEQLQHYQVSLDGDWLGIQSYEMIRIDERGYS